MGCGGCAQRAGGVKHADISACAVMCWACVEREGRDCGRSGRLIAWHVSQRQCPMQVFTPISIERRWLGVRWSGVPAVLRWAVRWLRPEGRRGERPYGYWPGCGCVARLKGWWLVATGGGLGEGVR